MAIKKDEFDEFHYKLIVVASDKGEAVAIAKETAFYKHIGFEKAPSHIDDKYGVEVDDSYDIEDILPDHLKREYMISITELSSNDRVEDEIHLGYQRYEKMK